MNKLIDKLNNLKGKVPKPVRKAIKEALRLGVLAALSYIIVFTLNFVTVMPETSTTLALTLVLRLIDKWLYEQGKATDNTILQRGITQF